ncbi:MAG: RHS repeat protein [Selenomonadaceae bacterium]|nr:RHS repeat protein [Selenomonadaceae bacterium]
MTVNGFPSAANLVPRTMRLEVDPITGMLALEVLDYAQWDIGRPFYLRRRYVPEPVGIKAKLKPMGKRWLLSVAGQAEGTNTEIRLPRGDFRWEAFYFRSGRWESSNRAEPLFLTEQSASLTLKAPHIPGEYRYDKNGMLIFSREQGLTRRFAYVGTTLTGITLATDGELSISGGGGHLTGLQDALGRAVRYEYDGELLKRVIYPNGGKAEYAYDERGLILLARERSGDLEATFTYDDYGRVVGQKTRTGESYRYEYADQDRVTTVREERSGACRKFFWNRQRQICRLTHADGTETRFEYDREGNLIWRQNRQGEVSGYEYDENGNLLAEMHPSVTYAYAYDGMGRLISRTRGDGAIINYAYNGEGYLIKRRTKLSLKDWREEIWERDMLGRITAYSLNRQVTRYAYEGGAPFPILMETATGNKFSYRYDRVYRLLAIRSPVGERTFGYNALDLMAGDTDGLGREKHFAYDLTGRPKEEGEHLKIWARFPWPKLRPPVTKEIPTSYKGKEAGEGNSCLCRRDLGERLLEWRRVDETFPPERPYRLTRWRYDTTDNVVEERLWLDPQDETGATGRIQIRRYEYDAENRLLKQTDSRGETIEYAYDALGACVQERHLTGTTLTALIRYVYDGVGRLIARDEKSDYQKTGKLWEHSEFKLDEVGRCRMATFPDGSQLTGEAAEAAYAAVCPRRYPDCSGYL